MPAELSGSEVNGGAHLAQSPSICLNTQYLRLAARLSWRTQAQLGDGGAAAALAHKKARTSWTQLSGDVSSCVSEGSAAPFTIRQTKKSRVKFLSSTAEWWQPANADLAGLKCTQQYQLDININRP